MKAVISYFISCLAAAIALMGFSYLITLLMSGRVLAEIVRSLAILGELGIMALFLTFCAMKAWQNVRFATPREHKGRMPSGAQRGTSGIYIDVDD